MLAEPQAELHLEAEAGAPPWFAPAVAAAVAAAVAPRLDLIDARLDGIDARLDRVDVRSQAADARSQNSGCRRETDRLMPLPSTVALGAPIPAAFPANLGTLQGLNGAQLTILENFYGLPGGGTVRRRRQALGLHLTGHHGLGSLGFTEGTSRGSVVPKVLCKLIDAFAFELLRPPGNRACQLQSAGKQAQYLGVATNSWG